MKPNDVACLAVVAEVDSRRAKASLDNIAGYVNAQSLRELPASSAVGLFHRLIYWESGNRIYSDYPTIRFRQAVQLKQGRLYRLIPSGLARWCPVVQCRHPVMPHRRDMS